MVSGLGRCIDFLRVRGWKSDFPSVQRVLDFLQYRKSASEQSKAAFCYILCALCRFVGKSPDELVGLPREEVEKLSQDFCDKLLERSRRRGPSASYPNLALRCLKTFFRVNGFNRENGNELRLVKYHQPPRVRNRGEYIPTLEEAHRMAERAGSFRNRAIVRTLYSTGLRNSALRSLRYGEIQSEIESGAEILLVKVYPELNSRVAGACKGDILYHCFLPKHATVDVRAMLDEKRERMGKIDSIEPLFPSTYNRIPRMNRVLKALSSRELALIVKNSARNADIKEWKLVTPHSLRKVFERVLRSPLSDGSNLDPKDQEYFMGHVLPGSQDTYYDKTKIEEMREKYAKLVFEPGPSTQEMTMQMLEKIAHAQGVDVEKLLSDRNNALGRPLSPKEREETILGAMKSLIKSEGELEQKVVNESELETYLRKGWRVAQALASGKVVVEKQTTHKAEAVNDLLDKSLSIEAPQATVSPKDNEQEGGAARQTQLGSYLMSQEPYIRKIDVNQEIPSEAKSPVGNRNRSKLKNKNNVDLGLFL